MQNIIVCPRCVADPVTNFQLSRANAFKVVVVSFLKRHRSSHVARNLERTQVRRDIKIKLPNLVAQTGSLPYRRLATCRANRNFPCTLHYRRPADCQSATQRIDNLRYVRAR